jgi:hypothetical protein
LRCISEIRPGLDFKLTVAEIFEFAKLSPSGPVPWGADSPETNSGVYVVARVSDLNATCEGALQLSNLCGIDLDWEYERQRWLPNEPIVYVGKTDRPLRKRLAEFRCHRCGNKSPHAGGQVVKLLCCDLWVYWAPSGDPYGIEQIMLRAFEKQLGKPPFANQLPGRSRRRIRRST